MKPKAVRFGRWRVPLPSSRPARIALGVALLLGGSVGFLPILGFWMVPLGLAVLAVDSPRAGLLLYRMEGWFRRYAPPRLRRAFGATMTSGENRPGDSERQG